MGSLVCQTEEGDLVNLIDRQHFQQCNDHSFIWTILSSILKTGVGLECTTLIQITNATKLLLTLIIPGQQTFQLLKQFNKMLFVNFPPEIIDVSWGPSTHCLWCYLPYGEKYLFIPVICLLALNQFLIPFQYINKSYVLQCYTLTMGLI